jgi:hypothetical protein
MADMIEWFCEGLSTKHGHFKIIRKDGFCADPFLLNTDIVLYEFFSYKDGRGWIEAYDIGLDVSYKVFDNYRHCSFPFIFELNSKKYAIPEQNDCALLQAIPILFNKQGRVIFDEDNSISLTEGRHIVDTMLLSYDNEVLCIYNEDVGYIGDPGGTLLARYIDFGQGGFHANEKHLLSADYRISRNAGSIWTFDNDIYTTYQKKKKYSYGDGLGIHKIDIHSKILSPSVKTKESGYITKNMETKSHHIDFSKPHLGVVWDVKI